MKREDILKPPPWEGDEHALSLIQEYIEELTGFEGGISLEDLLVEDIGLDSLDFLELFFKIQTYARRELSNQQLNRLLQAEVRADGTAGSDEQGLSLYSRLRVRHLVGLLRRQLSHPLDQEGFRYAIWKDRFFPANQARMPVEQTWKDLIHNLVKTEAGLKGRLSDLDEIEIETLEFFWLEDDLGTQVLEDRLRTQEGDFDNLKGLEFQLERYLEDEDLLQSLRLQLAQDCLLRSLDVRKRGENSGDEWEWVAAEFVDQQLAQENLKQWFDPGLLQSELTEEDEARLSEVLRSKTVGFIRLKIDQILNTPGQQNELLQDFMQDEYDPSEPAMFSAGNFQESQVRLIHWYVRNHRVSLIEEFREAYQEEVLNELQVVPQLEPFSQSQQDFMDAYARLPKVKGPERLSDLSKRLDGKIEFDCQKIQKNWEAIEQEFQHCLGILRGEWSSPLNYLCRFPRLGSLEERISLHNFRT